MEQNIYRLANRIHLPGTEVHMINQNADRTGALTENNLTENNLTENYLKEESVKAQAAGGTIPEDQYNGKPDDFPRMKYEQSVLCKIRTDRRARRRKRMRVAAASLAVLAAVTAAFHEEVRAAIGRIGYSLGTALKLQDSLDEYKEVVRTTIHDGGYLVTLEEAVVAPQKLVLGYTVRREDGQPFTNGFENAYRIDPRTCFNVTDRLYINGIQTVENRVCRLDFLDEEEKILGGQNAYDITDTDLALENVYELKLSYGSGNWNFRFKADGAAMYGDAKRMALENRFVLPDGTVLTLDELCVNALEQKILLHASEKDVLEAYAITLEAVDDRGRTAEFYLTGSEDGIHYTMYASAGSYLPEGARTAAIAMYAAKFENAGPETVEGRVLKAGNKSALTPEGDDGTVWDLTALRRSGAAAHGQKLP